MEIIIAILSLGGGFIFVKALAINSRSISIAVFTGELASCLLIYTGIASLIYVSSLFFVASFALAGVGLGLSDVWLGQRKKLTMA